MTPQPPIQTTLVSAVESGDGDVSVQQASSAGDGMTQAQPGASAVGSDVCSWALVSDDVTRKCREAPFGTEVLCVFHLPDPTKPTTSLVAALGEIQAGRRRAECAGWVFNTFVNLRNVRLSDSDFESTVFLEGVDFRGCRFDRLANFQRAIFGRDALFDSAHFPAGCLVSDAVFRGQASFSNGRFGNDMAVDASRFEQDADFSWTRFDEGLLMSGARFTRAANFSNLQLARLTVLDDVSFGAGSQLHASDLSKVVFRSCDLSLMALDGSVGLSAAQIDSCAWAVWPDSLDYLPNRPRRPWARRLYDSPRLGGLPLAIRERMPMRGEVRGVVFEELAARLDPGEEHYKAAEHVYRELRRGLEERRQYREAYRLGARELEMRRRALGSVSGPASALRSHVFSLEALYGLTSDYGQSLLRPLLWLGAVILLIYPILFAAAGVNLGTGKHSFDIGLPYSFESHGQLIAFAVRTASLANDAPDLRLGPLAQVIQSSLRVVGPLFALLATVVIRRRLRR